MHLGRIAGPWYWRADFVNELCDQAIALHVKHGSALPTWKSLMHLYPIDGAASEPSDDATPWAYRGAKWAEVIVGVDPDPANADLLRRWTVERQLRAAGRDQAEVRPRNFFHVNQDIHPAT